MSTPWPDVDVIFRLHSGAPSERSKAATPVEVDAYNLPHPIDTPHGPMLKPRGSVFHRT